MASDLERLKELFAAAVDLPDPPARQVFLERECGGDTGLRQRLEALLAAHDQPQPVLDRPLAALAGAEAEAEVGARDQQRQADVTKADASAGAAGTTIADKYKLLEK